MKAFPLGKVFHLLEPGPVVLLTTFHKGRANIMTMSWHMMMEFEPPLIGCLVSGANHSFTALRKTRECVIAIPAVDLISKVVDIGNCSGEDVDKFEKSGLTPVPAKQVKAPLIAECLFNIECKLVDTSMVNKYNMFILEGVKAWSDPKRKERKMFHANGDGTFVVDGKTIDLKKKMVKWTNLG
jgi:flavin reductase (DIM6/NTAB) family NADH-FMN oxidoreductase RutF